jgi:homoserine dehydrogenase
VVADLVNIARNIAGNITPPPAIQLSSDIKISPMSNLETKYYLRLNVMERPGVFARILTVLGELGISIASAIQKETDEEAQRAEIVLMTHRAKEASVQEALKRIAQMDIVNEIGNLIRVEEG